MSNDELQYPLLRIFIDEMGHALTANAIRHAAESKTALAARCSNLRRGSFMAMLPEPEHLSLSYPEAALMSAYGTSLP
jgi:hypothetical protein